MIEFKNVTKAYKGGKNVLNGLDLTIEDGEFVFIVGETGAGKTTMMKLLLCEEKVDSGALNVAGFDLARLPAYKLPKYRRKLGIVFQDFRLFPRMTVGLEHKRKSYPEELSGGEQQKVALARALVNGPDIIIADEPTGNLDPETSQGIMNLLMHFNRLNKTVIVVTHERELISHYGKRIVMLEGGKARELTPEEVKR